MKRAYICPQMGKKIVSDAHWGKIHVWDVESDDLLNTIEIQEDLFLSNISDDGNHLVLQYLDGIFEVWDLSTNVLEHQLNIQPFSTYSISIGPDGKKIALTSLDGEIHIWDTSMSPSRLLFDDSEKTVKIVLFLVDQRAKTEAYQSIQMEQPLLQEMRIKTFGFGIYKMETY